MINPLEQKSTIVSVFICPNDGIIQPNEVWQAGDDGLPLCPFCAQELDIEFVEEQQPVEVKSS